MDLEKIAAAIGDMLSKRLAPMRKAVTQVAEALTGIERRLKEVEGRQPEKGDKGDPGKDADPVEITHEDIAKALREDPALLQDVVAEHFKNNPVPAGKDADPITDEQIETAVKRHLEKHPVPAGKDADPVTEEQIAKSVTAYLKEHPPEKGESGVGVTGATINRSGELVLTTSDGRTHDLGPVIGKDGTDLSDVDFEYDGQRTITVSAKGGQIVRKYQMPIVIDKGYWRKGMECEAGDAVTFDGAIWIAKKATTEKPGTGAKEDWRLGVRKGRDGTTTVKYKEQDKTPVKLTGKGDEQND